MAMLTFRSTSSHSAGCHSAASSADGHHLSGLVRIENVELFFDVMSVMQQIHQAQFAGFNRAVVPNTVAMLGLVSEPHLVFKVDDHVFPISRYIVLVPTMGLFSAFEELRKRAPPLYLARPPSVSSSAAV